MKTPLFALMLIAAAIAAPVHAAPHRYDHVVIVVEENRTVGEIVGDTTNAPYINGLAIGGVILSNMFAIEHPSQPNYFHLFSGGNQGVEDDNLPTDYSTTPTANYPFAAPNLAAELIARGFTFAGFSEDLEAAGAMDWADYDPHTATAPGVDYRRKHNPWANWVAKVSPIPANQLPSSVNRTFTQFPADFTQLPTVSFIVPDQSHDMHNGSRKEGDTWLQANLNAYAQWAKAHNSLLVVTWDEDDYGATNQIPTVLYGAGLRNGTSVGGTWTHHNMLRTLEDMYGSTSHAGVAAEVRPIIGPFTDDPNVIVKAFRQELDGYNGARDTMLLEDDPGADNSANHDLKVDKDTSSAAGNQQAQTLVRFDNLFGTSANQIPANATLHSAKLILFTPANSTGNDNASNDTMRAHRILVDWTDTATWNSLGGGVASDNTQAVSAATFSFIPEVDAAPVILDVTSDLELFRSGTAPNRGWLLRASSFGSGDGWVLKSSETASDVTIRPTLEIVYSLPALSPFATWAANAGLTAPDNNPQDDAEDDGSENVIEFAFNLNPKVPDSLPMLPGGTSGLPLAQNVNIPGGHALEITFLRRKAPTGIGLTYSAQFSSDLDNWSGGLTPAVSNVNTDWERVTVRDNAPAASAVRYARVQVILAP